MKLNRTRAGALAVALMCVAALAACSGATSPASPAAAGCPGVNLPQAYGCAPAPAAGKQTAGLVTVAELTSLEVNWIFPITSGAYSSVYNQDQFQHNMWRPLYWTVEGGGRQLNSTLSLADQPVWSGGDTTVSVTLKPGYNWSDGQPVVARDIVFWYDLVKAGLAESPDNWAQYTPGVGIPDQVASVTATSASTVVFKLKKAVNPAWFTLDELAAITPLPAQAWAIDATGGATLDFTSAANAAKIFNYLTAQSKSEASYATTPIWQVVDGPYKLASFSTDGEYKMVPNTGYDGPHAAAVSAYEFVPFTSETALWNAVKAGAVDVAQVPSQDVPQVAALKSSYNAFGYPNFGFEYVVYNFKDTTGDFASLIGQLYIRQALAHLENEPGWIRAFMHSAGGTSYGPVGAVPASPYTPSTATTDPYPFSVAAAKALLSAHGWTVTPGGTDSCARPGTAANECGAGIPAGTKLAWNLIIDSTNQITTDMNTDWVSEASQAGIQMTIKASNFNYIISNYSDPSQPSNENKWAMVDFGGFSTDAYPTTLGIFNTGGSFDEGGYADSTASSLVSASVSSPDAGAVKNEASYLENQQPGLFQPNPDYIYVWKKTLSGPASAFESLTQWTDNIESWYFTGS